MMDDLSIPQTATSLTKLKFSSIILNSNFEKKEKMQTSNRYFLETEMKIFTSPVESMNNKNLWGLKLISTTALVFFVFFLFLNFREPPPSFSIVN